jgi:hypothetical protein
MTQGTAAARGITGTVLADFLALGARAALAGVAAAGGLVALVLLLTGVA